MTVIEKYKLVSETLEHETNKTEGQEHENTETRIRITDLKFQL